MWATRSVRRVFLTRTSLHLSTARTRFSVRPANRCAEHAVESSSNRFVTDLPSALYRSPSGHPKELLLNFQIIRFPNHRWQELDLQPNFHALLWSRLYDLTLWLLKASTEFADSREFLSFRPPPAHHPQPLSPSPERLIRRRKFTFRLHFRTMSSNLNADHHANSQTATTNQSNHDQRPVLTGAADSAAEPSEEDGGLADANNNRIGSAAKIADEKSATNRGSNAANISNGNNSSNGNSCNSSKQNKVERIRECINQFLR